MTHYPFRAAMLAGAALLALAGPVLAQDAEPAPADPAASGDLLTAEPPAPADPKEVLATVNGEPITRQEVLDSARGLPPQVQQQVEMLLPQLLNRLIGMKLIGVKAREAGLADDPAIIAAVKAFEQDEVNQAYLRREVGKIVTDDAIKAAYEEELKQHPPLPEVRARHILVETEEEAKTLIGQIQAGADFAALAKEKSIDKASGAEGGELGWFAKDMMVKEFADAAFALKKGELAPAPVKSQFGWHIIEAEDTRMQPPPTLEARRAEIGKGLADQAVHKMVTDLIAANKVEISPPYKLPAGQ